MYTFKITEKGDRTIFSDEEIPSCECCHTPKEYGDTDVFWWESQKSFLCRECASNPELYSKAIYEDTFYLATLKRKERKSVYNDK